MHSNVDMTTIILTQLLFIPSMNRVKFVKNGACDTHPANLGIMKSFAYKVQLLCNDLHSYIALVTIESVSLYMILHILWQVTPASSMWEQSCIPIPLCGQ